MENETIPTLHVDGGAKKSYKILFTTFVLIIVYTAVLGCVIMYLLNGNAEIQTAQEHNNDKLKQIQEQIERLRIFVNSSKA